MTTDRLHFAKSDIGRKRPHNEDCFAADSLLGLYLVCDGMGGGNAGEVASRMAIDSILTHIRSGGDPSAAGIQDDDPNLMPTTNQLAHAIRAANAALFRASWESPKYAGMGTTVAAVRLSGRMLSVAHVGDSRVYLIRDGIMRALTADHSWVAEQVAQGYMTDEEAERSPRRNIVTRALGVESSVDIDLAEMPVLNGDLLLLCSDGLTRGVRCSDMLRALQKDGDLAEKTDRLIALANDAGGEDNITVMLVTVEGNAAGRLWHRLTQGWFLKAS
ncbi:MAG TPA: Stp1/IreP family PP2C-type Ser/Thr phosphatase [Nitrospira sp.]|nr:Stp1/IreP family PP2C-type Ser/Thr phosphatase [Nitrospira sp.]